MNGNIPLINNDFLCIVDFSKPEIAAVISSYVSRFGFYVPIFGFPAVTAERRENNDDVIDENSLSRSRAHEFDVLVGNSLAKLKGCNNLILGGLSDDQKSHLTFLQNYNVIEISSLSDVDFHLGAFLDNEDKYLVCRSDQILEGLFTAIHSSLKLKIEDNAPNIEKIPEGKEGIVIIEKNSTVASVVAINYAISINSAIKIVAPLAQYEENEIQFFIEEWKAGSKEAYDFLSKKINDRIAEVKFEEYQFATFFTEGLPYSILVENIIPCSYVHLIFRADLFIFNNLFYETTNGINSAVVFSPQFFKDEEISFIITTLQSKKNYVRELVGNDASVYNIDMHVKEFPFDLMHICSHGGEVNGYSLIQKFEDRDGQMHTVEYDEVVGFAPAEGIELISVHRKTIWRKFDGLVWRSPELKAKPYPHYVFTDMLKAISKSFKENTEIRKHKNNISGSCSIKCSDSIYQAMFQTLSPLSSPIIFNNSCWSWSGVAEVFLVGGARGYIGTLWKVDNKIASEAARIFYSLAFDKTVINSLHDAMRITKGTTNENIYIYWGLHFTILKNGSSTEQSKQNVFHSLLHSLSIWNEKAKEVTENSIQENIKKIIKWHSDQLFEYFLMDCLKLKISSSINRK